MVRGKRELIAGLVRDPQFGPCVMLGLGGISPRRSPTSCSPPRRSSARRRARPDRQLAQRRALHEAVPRRARGRPRRARGRARRPRQARAERPDVASVDLNPLIVATGSRSRSTRWSRSTSRRPLHRKPGDVRRQRATERRSSASRPLFHPRGVVVAGVSTHPGKFGFVAFHNLLRFGYAGQLFPVNRDGADVLGAPDADRRRREMPDGRRRPRLRVHAGADQRRPPARVRERAACAPPSSRAPATARRARTASAPSASWSTLANELGILLAGPNGQGVISTPVSMCAQIVAPYPPRGRISVASQSGNLVSTFLNYAVADRRRHREGDLVRATRRRPRSPTTSSTSPSTRTPPSRSRTSRACGTAARFADALRATSRAQAARAREGRRRGGGAARRREPHRLARDRRPRVRRRLPAVRRLRAPTRRARLRVGGDVRDPAAAARPARRRVHDRGRLGRARGRRVRGGGSRAGPAARRPARRDRRHRPGALEPQQPGRPRGRRDARHRARRCSTGSSRTRTSTR